MTYTIICPINCGKKIWWNCVERSRQVVNNVLDIFCTHRQTNQELASVPMMQRTNDGLYYVPNKFRERLVLPTGYLEELKAALVYEVHVTTTFTESINIHPRVVRSQLNKNLWTVMETFRR
ncbi:predicted protein [Aspergillus nidulans FGSC A4]|uniref:Uncharacterized protein n=1 Tax=Emericella nidulans (strain FGSC A4 / ATCC 38163 / CBS 112.46 / NRRL 194 / M139) TaxID=227321 RepID=Q5BB78_EMENI|nr:hypothetical protein [Aspergillus nidulans FGSC A4]EAA63859.1 predicted protein [Aspergillus nidulans FGSC A4]CBF86374.1 TPA: conserved hypothetical protein [Aspergillus nidulans FGSC A4]|eukprot:XP_659806.1 predicted protein [Aspergillus nidulans FGSC A4]